MFARASRPLFRRAIHTASRRPASTSNIVALSLGATAVTASYVTWRLNSNSQRIALDSPASSKATQTKTSTRQAPADTTSSDTTQSQEKPSGEKDKPAGGDESKPEGDGQQGSGASQGAYNPETGEINWDCPCLGGMAHGPCGMEFREAFSCFVHSEEEPKGIECVEKFKAMQDCFRAHPEVYADEIMDDDDDEPTGTAEQDNKSSSETVPSTDAAAASETVTAQS